MLIVLTNDDGIHSEKIEYTKKVLEKFGTVYRIAPKEQMSAKSMSLTIGGFEFEKIDEFNYAIHGTPVDCVGFAHFGLGLKPDLVVSGTNNGYNIGIDTRYSGTVGAGLQAQYYGYKSLAVSADRKGNTILERDLEKTLQYIFDNDLLSSEYTLNVNFAREKFVESKGIRLTNVYHQVFEYIPEVTGNKISPNRRFVMGQHLPVDSDAYSYKEGYTSISKIKI
jgi:5'-nucleotidase